MEGLIGTVVASLCSLAAGVVGSWLLLRTKKVEKESDAQTEEKKLEASAVQAFLDGQQSFNEYIERIVEQRVAAATAEMRQELEQLDSTIKQMRAESHEIYDAVRTRETQLWLWNVRGRTGPMPTFPRPILEKLALVHLADDHLDEDTHPVLGPEPDTPT